MKKILTLLIIVTFFLSCDPEDDNDGNSNSNDTTEIVNKNSKNDTTEIVITPEEAEQKSQEILQKTEDINNQLDSILEN